MPTTFANGRSIVHAGDGQVDTAAPPDVCKTPSPAGPVPVPYVNIAKSSDLADGTKSVKIEGNSVATERSNLSTSTGDEPGSAGGIISAKNKGKLTWQTRSLDVKFEGKGVVRFGDVTLHNGNTSNTAFKQMGGTGVAYGDDFNGLCEICQKEVDSHRILETPEMQAATARILSLLRERYAEQRPIIDKYLALREERSRIEEEYIIELKKATALQDELNKKTDILLGINKSVRDHAWASTMKDIQAQKLQRENAIKILRNQKYEHTKPITEQMKEAQEQVRSVHVLGYDESTKMFIRGYMVGALVCKCSNAPKKFAAASGEPTRGFKDILTKSGFSLVEAFTMTDRQIQITERFRRKWDCAAPKILKAARADRHRINSMSEQWFSPHQQTSVAVSYKLDGTMTRTEFQSYETVPSCDVCQEALIEDLCNNDHPCG